MIRLSSNITLVLKFFIPILWVTFFGLLGIVITIVDPETVGLLGQPMYKTIYFVGFFVFLLFLYFTLIQLKRVEYDRDDHLYITNYFKTIKINVGNIASLNRINLGITELITLRLKQKGRFGKKIHFISKRSNFDGFLIDHSSYISSLDKK